MLYLAYYLKGTVVIVFFEQSIVVNFKLSGVSRTSKQSKLVITYFEGIRVALSTADAFRLLISLAIGI